MTDGENVTEGRACASCGAQNEPAAQFCWQCYARFAAGVPAMVGATVGAPTPVGGDPSSAMAPQPPPALPPWQQMTSRYASASSLPEPIPESSAWGQRIVNLVLVVAVGIGGFLGWRTFMRDPFPQSIGGFQRIDAQAATVFEDAVKEIGKRLGVKMRGAVYGRGSDASFMAILSERTESTAGLDAAFLEPLPITDPRLPGSRYEEFERDGASFRCFSFRMEVSGTGCFWLDTETAGFVFTMQMTVTQGMELAAEVRRVVT